MCGIYGVWSERGAHSNEAFSTALAHRGPDDAGTWQRGGLLLGHRRLSIIDLSDDGHQPFTSPDGRYTVVYNGEVYNYLELREELLRVGASFESDTDTEVLLQAWAHWGERALDRIFGMFAFALWDAQDEKLVLVRDATGMKPLLYVGGEDEPFAFASEMKAFVGLPGFSVEVDESAAREYLGAGFIWSGDHSVVAGVHRLPPGHLMEVEDGRPRPPRRWWTPPNPTPLSRPVHEALDREADELLDVLREAVGQHLRADVPVGLMLSGGLDSSVLAALAAQVSTRPIRTITMGFEPYEADERDYAQAVATHVGSDHTEFVLRPADAADELRRSARFYDDLFWDTGTVPAFAGFRFCREAGLKVVLVGEGADELFGGYPPFRRLGGPLADRLPRRLNAYRFFRAYAWQRYDERVPAFVRLILDLYERADRDWFQTVRLFELEVQLPVNLNMKVDRASMASSVEARVPYQDRRVAEFALRTPSTLLLEPGGRGQPMRGKWLLRHMARRHGLVPEAVLDRAKMGTPIPSGWLTDERDFADEATRALLAPGSWASRLGLSRTIGPFLRERRRPLFLRPLLKYLHPAPLMWRLLILEAWSRAYSAR